MPPLGRGLIYLLAIEIIDNLYLILLMKGRSGDGSCAGNNGETDGFFRQKILLFCSFLLQNMLVFSVSDPPLSLSVD